MVTEGDTGFSVWLTGPSGSDPATVAPALAARIAGRGRPVEILDGDELRTDLSADLSFSTDDRDAHARRIGWVCELLGRHGVVAIVTAISPAPATRDEVRERLGRLVEIQMDAYTDKAAEESADRILARLEELGYLAGAESGTDAGAAYTEEEESEVTDRLRDLGYL